MTGRISRDNRVAAGGSQVLAALWMYHLHNPAFDLWDRPTEQTLSKQIASVVAKLAKKPNNPFTISPANRMFDSILAIPRGTHKKGNSYTSPYNPVTKRT